MIPDHTPYLVEGDLRTAWDVAEWLESRKFDFPYAKKEAPHRTLDLASIDLVERLDRERRQACRRGALECIQQIAREKLWLRRDYDSKGGRAHFGSFQKCMEHQREYRWGKTLRMALAFRASARD